MTTPNSFDRNGNPRTGFIPARIFSSGPASDAEMARCVDIARGRFQAEVDTGGLNQLRKTYRFSGGSRVEASFMFGVYWFRYTGPSAGKKEPEFFGGILIQPKYHAVEAGFIGYRNTVTHPFDHAGEPALRTLMVEVGEPTRPSVPGTATDDVTDWLVIQISKTKKLGPSSISSGAARVLRIKNPKFGDVTEAASEVNRYLLSTSPRNSPSVSRFHEFYLCGQHVTAIPPLTPAEFANRNGPTRLRTLGMSVNSFKTAYKAEGIVVFAIRERLYCVDTLNRPEGGSATWQLLDEKPGQSRMQSFGTEFTETRVGDLLTLTCSGTDGAGACSSFVVYVLTTESGRNITGEITPRYQTWLPAIPAGSTFSQQVQHTGASTITTLTMPATGLFDGTVLTYGTAYRGTTSWNTAAALTYTETSGRAEMAPDTFLGGYLPVTPERTASIQWTLSDSVSNEGFVKTTATGVFPEEYSAAVRTLRSMSVTLSMSGLSDAPSVVSATYNSNSFGNGIVTEFSSTSDGSLITYEGAIRDDPSTATRYVARDRHVGRVAVKQTQASNGSFTSSSTINLKNVFDVVPGGVNVSRPVTTAGVTSSIAVLQNTGAVLHSWSNLWDFLPAPPPMASPTAGSYLVMGAIPYTDPFGPLETFPAISHPHTRTYRGIGALERTRSLNEHVPPGVFPIPVEEFVSFDVGSGLTTVSLNQLSYNYTMSYPGGPASPMTVPNYMALYPISSYTLSPPAAPELPDSVGILPTVDLKFGTTPYSTASSTEIIADLIYGDMRSGGYIAQIHHRVPGIALNTQFVLVDTVVGNVKGSIPLKTLLDEWIDSKVRSTPEDRRVFIDHSPIYEVALI